MSTSSDALGGLPSGNALDNSKYAQSRRELLKLLAELHGTGIQSLLSLPQIAVLGSQSVGKSSLVESISGIKLPRESGTCTRCPMECRLEYVESESWSCRVSLRFGSTQELPFGNVITDPMDVEKRIRQAQRALLRPSLKPQLFIDDSDIGMPNDDSKSFTDDCVCIYIRGPDVTDLHFFDLPGIIVNVGETQDPSDIELVRSMARRYIGKKSCIILLVVSCETDFENQVAGRLIREVDAGGQRTVGVLTKPDKTDAESAPKWQKINDDYPLERGWFVVKLPDSRELREGISAGVALQRADAFFNSNEHWKAYSQQNRGLIGTLNLTEYLAGRLSGQLRESLPSIREAVQQQLVSTLAQLSGLPPQVNKDAIAGVFGQITEFAQEVSRHVRGNAPLRVDRRGLVQRLYAAYEGFKRAIRGTVPKFDARQDSAAEAGLKLTDFDSDDEEMPTSTDECIKAAQVMKVALEARTRELPGNYPFTVKAYYVSLFLNKWEAPTLSCFDAALTIFADELHIIIDEFFGPYSHGGLLTQVQMAVTTQLQVCAVVAKAELLLELHKETDAIFTQNYHYLASYKAKFLAHYKDVRNRKQPMELIEEAPVFEYETPGFLSAVSYKDPVEDALAALRRNGYSWITRSSLTRLYPTEPLDPALDIMSEVRAYFQVAYKRYIDAVPLCIERALIRKFEAQISTELVNELGLFEEGARAKCEAWVREPPAIAEKRTKLLSHKKTLENAHVLLLHFA